MRCCLAVLLVLLLTSTSPAEVLNTSDGLAVELTAQGRVSSVRVGSAAVPSNGEGSFDVCDFTDTSHLRNLVPNAGFEEGQKGWHLVAGQTLDHSTAHRGDVSVKLEVPRTAPGSSNVEVIVPVKPSTTYVAELWLRRHNVGVCGAYVSERDDNGHLTGPESQVGVNIPTIDDAWLPLQWELTTQPNTTRLSLRANIYRSSGTLWLDDFLISERNDRNYRPVLGTLSNHSGAVHFDGQRRDIGVRLQADFTADDRCVRISGELEDTTLSDRAVAVRFALPVDGAGWRWWDDAGISRVVDDHGKYRNTYRCVSGPGYCSVYPWSALTGSRANLSLALPLSQGPRVFVIEHDQHSAQFSITFYFGLSRLSLSHPSSAPFSLVIYRTDPAWGMRSAIERYYQLYPDSFRKRPAFEGYLNYADLESMDPSDHSLHVGPSVLPDASDFGEGCKFLLHLHGCYDFRQVPWPQGTRMSDAQVVSELEHLAEQEKASPGGYVPASQTIRKLCRGAFGEILYIGDTRYWKPNEGYNHTDVPGWGLNFRVDEDPRISPVLMQRSRARAENYAATHPKPWDAAFTADAIEGYFSNSNALDYAPEHLRATTLPLTFGSATLKPAMVNTIWDFLDQAWWPTSNQYKIVLSGNSNGYEQAFTLPFVDVALTEGSWDPAHPARLDRYLRSMAHHKIWRYWYVWNSHGEHGESDANLVAAQFARELAYDIYPSVYSIEVLAGDLERYRALYRQYVPALEELSMAGWEPVTHATASDDTGIERYGRFADGELHFTLRNWGGSPRDVQMQLDRTALGIPLDTQLLYLDILPGQSIFRRLPAQGLNIRLEAGQTLALWIGTAQQAAQHGMRLAGRMMEKIDRSFSAEMDEPTRALWQRAMQQARDGARAEADACQSIAESLQQALGALELGCKTRSPVDLAKLIYRARVYASMAPAARFGVAMMMPRLCEHVRRGEDMSLSGTISIPASVQLVGGSVTVLLPWAATAQAARATVDTTTGNVVMQLNVPMQPPRQLLPCLLEFRGTVGPSSVSLYAPIDVIVEPAVAVSVRPVSVKRGGDVTVRFILRNALAGAGHVNMTLRAPPRTRFEPAEFAVALPGQGEATQTVVWHVEPLASLGPARIGYTIGGEDGRFNGTGNLSIGILDGAP